ncbi:hypothetical protein L208DRAFT_1403109 [Tricholoma matsutake]|nr:hypothetical protein L208DRAFT_1403109 [Tricholoma matsutake 945]
MTPLSHVLSEGGVGVALLPSHGPCLYSLSSPIIIFIVAPLSTPQAEACGSRQRRHSHKYKYST